MTLLSLKLDLLAPKKGTDNLELENIATEETFVYNPYAIET